MEKNIENFSRKNILFLEAYKSARSIGGKGSIWLNANECPTSFSFNLKNNKFNRYPECQPKNLLIQYSYYTGIPIENILVSRGADEAIELLMKVFCTPKKDCIITFPPTYAMYSKISEIYEIENKMIFLDISNGFKIPNIKDKIKNVKLLYICRPNNPTGHIISVSDIVNILNITFEKALVIVDEAYIEFCYSENLLFLLSKYPHLVILRTLSKSFGLAGVRCGFTLAHPNVIHLLKKVIAPYPLPLPVIDIASQALDTFYLDAMKKKVLELNKNKIWLLDILKNINVIEKVFNSSANFILVKTITGKNVFEFLWNNGIIVRNQDHEFNLKNHIRISIGTKKECKHLVSVLKSII